MYIHICILYKMFVCLSVRSVLLASARQRCSVHSWGTTIPASQVSKNRTVSRGDATAECSGYTACGKGAASISKPQKPFMELRNLGMTNTRNAEIPASGR